ncbi:alpha/beta fold hydrolase [Robiginitalea sp. IMCC44478]|uniref:alpha/beta fold hydrolase n=1 Tax=Robiginitalea sp. IMCC44478 TaxID=3459122 RepID=UPI0040415DA1
MNKFTIVFIAALFLICCKPERTNKKIFSSFDGTKIAFEDEGTGEAVLLIHGFIVDGNSNWGDTALKRQLLEQGYRVIIPDLRGNGDSDKPQNKDAYKNDAEIKDLIALIDHLGIENYMAVGYSRGAIVLAKLLTIENRITKAVFGGMGLDFTKPDWDRRIAFGNVFSGRTQPDEMTKGAVDFAKDLNVDFRIMGYLQDYQPETSIDELNNIKIETLVISGEADLDNGKPEELQKEIPNSRLRIVSGNHMSTFKQKDFAEAIISFLKEK